MAITFDYNFYLEQKLAQLQTLEGYEDYTNTAQVVAAFEEAGLTVKEHYELYGAGEGLNPSADFDTNAYLEAKLEQLQSLGGYEDIQTTDDVLEAFKEAGLSPLDHYNQYGINEGLEAVPAGESTAGLTEALGTYQASVEARTEYLNDNADNELIEDQIEALNLADDVEPTPAQVEQAIADADEAADDAVVTAENAVLDSEAALVNARASTFQAAVGTDVAQGDIDTAVAALDSVSADSRMSAANLNAAETEAQSDVNADETVYTAAGVDVSTLEAVYKVEGDTATNSGLVDPTYITDDYAGVAQVTAYDYTGGTAAYALTVNGTEYTGDTGAGLATAITSGEDITAAFVADELTLTADDEGVAFTTSGAAATDATPTEIEEDAVAAFNTAEFIEANGSVGYAATDVVASGVAAEANVITEAKTAAEWQQSISEAEDAVTDFVASNGDNAEILVDVRDAIAAYAAAGNSLSAATIAGTATPDGVTSDLGALLDEINSVLSVQDDAETDANESEVAINALVDGFDFELTEAEADEPTAAEAAIQNAFATVETRDGLDDAVTSAESAFDNTVTGNVLNTVLELQEDRAELIAGIDTAETELTTAQGTAEETQALVDDLADLQGDIDTALATLNDSEEDGGFGVELRDFADNSDATADSDLYVFADDAGNTVNIDNFGDEGEDSIFFGEGYTLVNLGEDQTINNRVGSASELEIFVKQDGDNLNLYVESEAEAGRDLSDAAITTIALSDVSADDIELTGGLLTAGTSTVEVA